MRILIVTNLYPPYYRGGYEIHCAQVAEALQRAGHQVRVLTSTYGVPLTAVGTIRRRDDDVAGVSVHRWLHQYTFHPQPVVQWPWKILQARRELEDVTQFKRVVNEFKPDVINWWNLLGVTKAFLPLANKWKIPDVHAVDDHWLIDDYGPGGRLTASQWQDLWEGKWGPRFLRPVLRWLGRRWERRVREQGIPTSDFDHQPSCVCFLSDFLRVRHREAGFDFPSTKVLYGGVHVARFFESLPKVHAEGAPLRVLYAGQVTPDRGLHTIIEAFGHLSAAERERMTLTVVGSGHDAYLNQLRARVDHLQSADRVMWLGMVDHEQIPAVYKSHDLFVFSSTRPEGLGFVSIEALLAGCAVVTTGSGGAMEIALAADLPLFPKNDSVALSRLLAGLETDRREVLKIASRGQAVALQLFGFERMIAEWIGVFEDLGPVATAPQLSQQGGGRAIPSP
jgi:glycogen(starch) synthase